MAASQHRNILQCRALDGQPQFKPYSGGIALHCIERAPLSAQAGALSSRVFPGAEACLSCDRDPFLLRCRDVTDRFDTSTTRGLCQIHLFLVVLRPNVFRSFSAPGPAQFRHQSL